jgi:hypothetical protein
MNNQVNLLVLVCNLLVMTLPVHLEMLQRLLLELQVLMVQMVAPLIQLLFLSQSM